MGDVEVLEVPHFGDSLDAGREGTPDAVVAQVEELEAVGVAQHIRYGATQAEGVQVESQDPGSDIGERT